MAAIPALLVCYPAFSFLSGALLGFGSRSRARKHTVSREVARLLRDIDSLLIRNSVSSGLRLIEQPTPSSAALAPTASTLAPAAVPSSAALSALSRAHTLPQTPRMTRTAAADAKQSKTPVPPSRVASRTTGSGSGGHAPSRAPSPAPHRAGLLGVFPHRPSLGFKDNGGLLLGCYRLRLRAADLLRARAVSGVSFAALVEDIGLLEGCDFDVMQKRMIVARLSNQWPGANAAAR